MESTFTNAYALTNIMAGMILKNQSDIRADTSSHTRSNTPKQAHTCACNQMCAQVAGGQKSISPTIKKIHMYLRAKAACLRAKQVNPDPNLAVTKTGGILGGGVSVFMRQPKTSKKFKTSFSAKKKQEKRKTINSRTKRKPSHHQGEKSRECVICEGFEKL